jgi:hypothetical protein
MKQKGSEPYKFLQSLFPFAPVVAEKNNKM